MATAWTLRLGFSLVALLGLSGCPEPPPVCAIAPAIPQPNNQPGILLTGQQVQLSILPNSTVACFDVQEPRVTSVTAEIEGPDGKPVPNQIQLGRPGEPAILSLTPERPGSHHVLVAFAEEGGLHQFDLHVAQDRSAEAPSHYLPRACISLERTLQGAWVCDTDVLRGETTVRSFPGASLSVAGDVIWAVDGSNVHRYVDTGSALMHTGTLGHTRGIVEFLRASPDELVVLHRNVLALYSFRDGAVTSEGAQSWSRPLVPLDSSNTFGVLVRDGAQLALATRLTVDSNISVQVCPYQLSGGIFQRSSADCQQLPGELLGFEPTVLWTKDTPTPAAGGLDMGTLRRWVWTGGRLVEEGSLVLGIRTRAIYPPLRRPFAVPQLSADRPPPRIGLTTAVATWSAERRLILIEHLDEGMLSTSATPTLYWGRPPTSESNQPTKVRLRPAPLR
jgi:hypothetical protein